MSRIDALSALVGSEIYTATKIHNVASIAFPRGWVERLFPSLLLLFFARAHENRRDSGDNGTVTETMLRCRARRWPCPITDLRKSTGLNEPSSTCRSHSGPRLPREHVVVILKKKRGVKTLSRISAITREIYVYKKLRPAKRERKIMKMLVRYKTILYTSQ